MKIEEAQKSIKEIAKKEKISEEEVRNEMLLAIREGMNSTDPTVQKQWRDFKFKGKEPTPEEFIMYMASRVAGK